MYIRSVIEYVMLDKNPERKKSAPSTGWCCVIIQLDGFWNRPIQRKGCSSSRFRGNRGELFAEAESCETMARRTLATAYCTEQRTVTHGICSLAQSSTRNLLTAHWTVHWIGRSLLLARPILNPPDMSAQCRRFCCSRVVSPATIFNIRQIFWFPSAALSGTMRLFKLRRTDLKGQQRSQFDLQTWHTCLCAESDPLCPYYV